MFKLNKNIKKNRGMTYVELIVVLGIFVTMLSVSLFSYKKFQGKVDIKNLANDIALKLVESQKSSLSGKLPSLTQQALISSPATWKPSYGLYFNSVTPTQFLYFTDLDASGGCNGSGCTSPYSVTGEVQDVINITRGNTISSITVSGTSCPSITNLTVVFKRTVSTPTVSSTTSLVGCVVSYYAINILSPQGSTASIKLYPSGRIQIN